MQGRRDLCQCSSCVERCDGQEEFLCDFLALLVSLVVNRQCCRKIRNPKSEIHVLSSENSEFLIPNSEFLFEFFATDLFVDLEDLVATKLHGHEEKIMDRAFEVLAFGV